MFETDTICLYPANDKVLDFLQEDSQHFPVKVERTLQAMQMGVKICKTQFFDGNLFSLVGASGPNFSTIFQKSAAHRSGAFIIDSYMAQTKTSIKNSASP